jgi:hypothetical protein
MKIFQKPTMAKLLFCGGLLLISLVSFIARRLAIPDFAHGALIGVGIGMEVIGAIKLIHLKRSRQGEIEC